jgi:hypothetical protein
VIASRIDRTRLRPRDTGLGERNGRPGGLELDAVCDYRYAGLMRWFEDSLRRRREALFRASVPTRSRNGRNARR